MTDIIDGYIGSFEPELPEKIKEIEEYGKANAVPIIRTESRTILRFLLNSRKPVRILEIGTAIGFSACYMAYYSGRNVKISTIEKMPERAEIAAENIKKTNFCDIISLFTGDACDVMGKMCEEGKKFDFVFMDAAKAQYGNYLTYIKQLLSDDGMLLTDNILQEGSVAASKFSVMRRDRTIHQRMREFLDEMMRGDDFDSMIIPVGDGLLISTKKGAKDE